MMPSLLKSSLLRISLSALLLVLAPIASGTMVSASSVRVTDLSPSREHSILATTIVQRLQESHYRKHQIDDRLSSAIFDRYLADLDPARTYFLATDVQEFEVYRTEFDDALKAGNLNPAFRIFNRYQRRLIDRLAFTEKLLATEFDSWTFDGQGSMEVERKKSPWAADQAASDQLWRERLMGSALAQRLNGKPMDEIKKSLIRSNQNSTTRAIQVNAEDAFSIFINSFAQNYDPHTQYLSPEVSANFNINMKLELEGIGAVLQMEEEYTKIQSLVTGGPAERSGMLKPSDRIVGVAQDGDEMIDVIGWRLDEVVKRIRGDKGTKVTLEILPSGSAAEKGTRSVTLTRDKINLEDRASQKIIIDTDHNGKKRKVGVIYIPTFYSNFDCINARNPSCRSVTRDVANLIRQLQQEKIDALVIDLRNNGGGSLQEAIGIVGLFVPSGPIVQLKNATGRLEVYPDLDPAVLYNGPLSILVNRLSASASEIFAGAIQDYGRGLIIGETTYGKGTVQTLRTLDQGQLKVTVSKFYRISGDTNQHKGVVPDIRLPSLIDPTENGESAAPNALTPDTIRAANFRKGPALTPLVPALIQASASRIAQDADFVYLAGQIKLAEETRAKKRISLNQAMRLKERDDFDRRVMVLENAKRKAKGEKPFASLDEMRKVTEEEELKALADAGKFKQDYVLTEVAHIMDDFLVALRVP